MFIMRGVIVKAIVDSIVNTYAVEVNFKVIKV